MRDHSIRKRKKGAARSYSPRHHVDARGAHLANRMCVVLCGVSPPNQSEREDD